MTDLYRYDIKTDSRVVVTQEWVDQTEMFIQKFGKLRENAKSMQCVSQEFLDAWKPAFGQKK